MKEKNLWHHLEWKEVVKLLNSNENFGLSLEEVKKRQKIFGPNKIAKEKRFSSFKLFLDQFKSPLIYLLIFAGTLALALKKYSDSLAIFLALFINALFGFFEEHKVSKVLEKLKKEVKTKAVVLREGKKKEVFSEEIVPGDIIFLKSGDKVPADARLIEAKNLKISEAILTGEWLPSLKVTQALPKETPLADRENMVYFGSLVENGSGKAVVVATGKETEVGKVASLLKETKEEKTPLQKKMIGFSKILGAVIAFICVFIFIGGILRGKDSLEMFETSVAITVGGIPEALPVIMTLVLVIGMQRILRKKGLIRKLASVETLGSTQIICFDKTKTLTQGKMEVAQIEAEDKFLLLKAALLATEAFIENSEENPENWKIKGSPTDIAIVKKASQEGILKPELEKKSLLLNSFPFDSKLKYEATLRKENNKTFLYLSGAPEKLLEFSKNKENWKEKIEKMAQKGLRVIGIAFKEISDEKEIDPKNCHFLGLIGLKDPLREDVKEAIEICQKAGMRPILVTGDHKLTAKAVASEIGLEVKEEEILEGKDLEKLSQKELEEKVEKIKIYARVLPEDKLRIVEAWQKKGKVVAMTGDGVNDAPALKRADIGIALGSGTEVAKEAADFILLDDSFSAIIKTIEEGRIILDNIRKAITYVLSDSFASMILVGVGTVIFGWPLPILPAQILWNNLVEDTFPNIAYAFEPKEKDVMKRKPSPLKAPLLTREMKILIFLVGIIDQFFVLLLFWLLWAKFQLPLEKIRTLIFGAFCLDTAFVIYSFKSLRKNLWEINPFSNKYLNLSSLLVVAFFALSIYLPPLQKILKTTFLGIFDWLILILVGILSLLLIEISKLIFIKKKL